MPRPRLIAEGLGSPFPRMRGRETNTNKQKCTSGSENFKNREVRVKGKAGLESGWLLCRGDL